jgi:hypothetical protein
MKVTIDFSLRDQTSTRGNPLVDVNILIEGRG